MKLGIMQPYFFPYLGYFQLIRAVDAFLLYDNVTYIKKGWINRNRLLATNHEPVFMTVPITKHSKSSNRKIRDVKLAKTEWRQPLLERIERHYGRSTHFRIIFPILESVLGFHTDSLAALNNKGILEICNFLDIDTEIVTDVRRFDELETQLAGDEATLATRFPGTTEQPPSRREIRIIQMCRALGASTFLNATGGAALYDKGTFRDNGIDLWFVRTLDYSYAQPSSTFHADLSIIDVLMNCGKQMTKALLDRYELV